MNTLDRCDCRTTEVRRKLTVNGRPMYGLQCVVCGHTVGGWLRKEEWPKDAPPWDDGLSGRYWSLRTDAAREAVDDQRAAALAEWRRQHDLYLATPEWSALRSLVCEREGGICQGCRAKRGKHAHHLTYVRWRKELLIDLVWLCSDCHRRAHEAPIPRLGAP